MERHMRASILILLACGCTADDGSPATDLVEIEPGNITEIQIVPTTGSGIFSVPIRLNNVFGLALPGGAPPTITVTGPGAALLSKDLTPDTFGVVTAEISTNQPAVITIDADGAIGQVWSVGGEAPPIQAIRGAPYPIDAPYPSFAASGTGGSAFAGDDQIWWQPVTPGAPAWKTADLPSLVEGMWTAQIDNDGVDDLAVWAGEQIYLLRGWPGGGYAWGAAWDVPGGDVVGLSAVDVDGDRLVDLVVGIDYGGDSRVELLLGDGAWGFEISEPLDLTFGITTLTAADEDRDGAPDISMLRSVDGAVRRYSYLDGGWSGGTPAQISDGNDSTLLGGTLLPMVDLNGDGDLELVIEGPKGASSQRLVFYAFSGQSIIKYEQSYADYYLDVADMEGDGAVDVLAAEDGTLHLTRFDPSGGSFVAQNFSDIGESGPLAIGDVDGDTLLDLTVFGDSTSYYPGALSEGAASPPGISDCIDGEDNDLDGNIDADDPQCDGWRLAGYTWRTFALGLDGDYHILDLDGDGADDIIGYVGSSDGTGYDLEAWRTTIGDEGTPQLLPGDGYELYNSGTPLGLAVCDSDIYTLYETLSGSLILARLEIEGGSALTQARSTNEVTGRLLACGTIDGQDVAVVSAASGEWVSYEQSRLDAVGSGFIESVSAVAVANGVVVGCQADGCDVVAGDVDGDGQDEVFRSDGAGITVTGWGVEQELAGDGALRLVDGDGDGRPELL
ncbi:MAG: hypothetical protein ACI8S6_004051, partial [Myxococcota bacterium]